MKSAPSLRTSAATHILGFFHAYCRARPVYYKYVPHDQRTGSNSQLSLALLLFFLSVRLALVPTCSQRGHDISPMLPSSRFSLRPLGRRQEPAVVLPLLLLPPAPNWRLCIQDGHRPSPPTIADRLTLLLSLSPAYLLFCAERAGDEKGEEGIPGCIRCGSILAL